MISMTTIFISRTVQRGVLDMENSRADFQVLCFWGINLPCMANMQYSTMH